MTILSDNEINSRCVKPTISFILRDKYPGVDQVFDSPLKHYHGDPEKFHLHIKSFLDGVTGREVLIQDADYSDFQPMITPFVNHLVNRNDNGEKIISWGLSSFGYDVRMEPEMKLFTNINSTVINPKKLNVEGDRCLVDVVPREDGSVLIPPNSYALGVTKEYFNLPRDVTFICLSKSTYARAGLIINATVAEAGWSGNLVVEIANSTSLPVMIFPEEGIAQILFLQGKQECDVSYADRNGKYQHQQGITLPKV
jgi:dCTP deaminase